MNNFVDLESRTVSANEIPSKFNFGKDADDYDLEVEISKTSNQPPINESPTSKQVCTVACGRTRGNSCICSVNC